MTKRVIIFRVDTLWEISSSWQYLERQYLPCAFPSDNLWDLLWLFSQTKNRSAGLSTSSLQIYFYHREAMKEILLQEEEEERKKEFNLFKNLGTTFSSLQALPSWTFNEYKEPQEKIFNHFTVIRKMNYQSFPMGRYSEQKSLDPQCPCLFHKMT